jgi:hypothetical protein
MKKAHLLKDLASRLYAALPKDLHTAKMDIEKNFHGILMTAFAKLELVTREEFDVQSKVLARTRKKLDDLEAEIKKLEKTSKQKTEKK